MFKGICTFTLGECNGTPGFRINDSILYPNCAKGSSKLVFEYELGTDIEFEMFGKVSNNDTFLKNNQIVKDKYILIETLQLEYIKLENWQFHKYIFDPYFGYNKEVRRLHISKNYIDWWLDYAI